MHLFRWNNDNVEMFSAAGSTQDSTRACRQLRKNWIKLMLNWRQLQENYWLDMNSKWACLIYQHETEKNNYVYIHMTTPW